MRNVLLVSAALYVAVRALLVLSIGDAFIYGEEFEKGTVAAALASGVDVPYARMPFHPYEGGGFVASHLKLAAFALVGENVLAHKLCAIAWGLLVLAASIAFAERHGGRGAAWTIGILLGCAPAHFVGQSLIHLGIHYEALLFIALTFDLGLRVAATPKGERPDRRLLVGLGLAAGFGTYFSYQVPIAVLAVIALMAATGWRRIFEPALVVSTLVGLLPLALMALAVGNEVLDIHGSDVGAKGGAERVLNALGVGLSGALPRAEVAFGAVALGLGLFVAPPRDDRRRALLLLFGFSGLWLGAAAASAMIPPVAEGAHWVRFIRFAPFAFALLLAVAVAAGPARIPRGIALCIAPLGLVGLVTGLGLRADVGSWPAHFDRLRRTSGVEIRGALVKIAPRLADEAEPDVAARAAAAVAPYGALQDARDDFLAAELASAATHRLGGDDPDAVLDALDAVLDDRFSRDALALGLGPVVQRSIRGDVRTALLDPAFDPLYAEALGRFGSGYLSLEPFVAMELETARGTVHRDAFLRGLGRRIFRCSVTQSYWGWSLRLRPERARARMIEVAREGAADDAEIDALCNGFDGAARDFGLAPTTLPR
ncbi:MAG: hypothetical protein AAGA20_23685 [Planctomycetota bacterium]